MTTAPPAAEADVRAQAVNGPGVVAAGVGSLEPDDIAQEQLEDGLVRHSARQRNKQDGIRVVGRRVPGRAPASVAGSSRRVTGVTVRVTSGYVAATWATIPPIRVSDPVSVSAPPIADTVNGSSRRSPSTATSPGPPVTTEPATMTDAVDRDRLGAGVAQLVDQVLDRWTVDRPVDGHRYARPDDGVQARVRADRPELVPDLPERHNAAVRVGRKGRQVTFERGDLLATLVEAGVEVGHEDRQVL